MHIKVKFVIGYITIKGGHRIGITGTAVIEENKVINIKYIQFKRYANKYNFKIK